MIVRFFKTGLSHGEGPVHYLFSEKDHAGHERGRAPELLEGNPQLTIDLINGITRKYKYASGCLAFRANECPSGAELLGILDRFKSVVAPGLSSDQFNSLFVLHRDSPDSKTGQAGFHVHFVLPMTLLGGKTPSGKSLAGKRWNPHPPGQQTIETFARFTEVINHEHGWRQVVERPLRVNVDSFWRKAKQASHSQKPELLQKELGKAIRSGTIRDRGELILFMDQTLGLTITRVSVSTISVKFPGSVKALKLRGPMFEATTDYATLRDASRHTQGTEHLSVPDYLHTRTRLEALLIERAAVLVGDRKTNYANTTTRKERVYGRLEKRFRRGDEHHPNDGWKPSLPFPAGGMERNLFPSGGEQWRHGYGRGSEAGIAGEQEAQNRVQYARHASGGPSEGSGRRRVTGQRAQTFGLTIEQKIRELGMQLNECELGSVEASSIMEQLNVLKGERERIAYGPRMRR